MTLSSKIYKNAFSKKKKKYIYIYIYIQKQEYFVKSMHLCLIDGNKCFSIFTIRLQKIKKKKKKYFHYFVTTHATFSSFGLLKSCFGDIRGSFESW